MYQMPIVSVGDCVETLSITGRRVSVLWEQPGSLVFIARGREYRSEFHINPCDEVMYQIRGTMHLHYRTPEGREEIAVIPEGSAIHTPAGIPHSPRFPPDAFAMIIERKRRPGEIDRFRWYCDACDALLHEEECFIEDYASDPVAGAYKRFLGVLDHRTCSQCGFVAPDSFASSAT